MAAVRRWPVSRLLCAGRRLFWRIVNSATFAFVAIAAPSIHRLIDLGDTFHLAAQCARSAEVLGHGIVLGRKTPSVAHN